MDYSSDLENCNQEIEIKINSLITLNNIANNLEKYYPEVAKEYKKTISISNNSKLTDFKIICKIIPNIN